MTSKIDPHKRASPSPRVLTEMYVPDVPPHPSKQASAVIATNGPIERGGVYFLISRALGAPLNVCICLQCSETNCHLSSQLLHKAVCDDSFAIWHAHGAGFFTNTWYVKPRSIRHDNPNPPFRKSRVKHLTLHMEIFWPSRRNTPNHTPTGIFGSLAHFCEKPCILLSLLLSPRPRQLPSPRAQDWRQRWLPVFPRYRSTGCHGDSGSRGDAVPHGASDEHHWCVACMHVCMSIVASPHTGTLATFAFALRLFCIFLNTPNIFSLRFFFARCSLFAPDSQLASCSQSNLALLMGLYYLGNHGPWRAYYLVGVGEPSKAKKNPQSASKNCIFWQ